MIRRLLMIAALILAVSAAGSAQAPAAPVAEVRVYANMLQVMRGVLYPASNVIFTAQSDDPASFKPGLRPSTSPDPFTSAYGGWEAVENAGLALSESANLLIVPRQCGNGRPAPVKNADWLLWVQELRDAGMAVYKAGQSKNQDTVIEAADMMTTACANCHDKYREKPNLLDRCM